MTSETDTKATSTKEGSYFYTRIVFLRYLGLIYCIAFLVAFHQNEALIGEHGLTPAKSYLGLSSAVMKQKLF